MKKILLKVCCFILIVSCLPVHAAAIEPGTQSINSQENSWSDEDDLSQDSERKEIIESGEEEEKNDETPNTMVDNNVVQERKIENSSMKSNDDTNDDTNDDIDGNPSINEIL